MLTTLKETIKERRKITKMNLKTLKLKLKKDRKKPLITFQDKKTNKKNKI